MRKHIIFGLAVLAGLVGLTATAHAQVFIHVPFVTVRVGTPGPVIVNPPVTGPIVIGQPVDVPPVGVQPLPPRLIGNAPPPVVVARRARRLTNSRNRSSPRRDVMRSSSSIR